MSSRERLSTQHLSPLLASLPSQPGHPSFTIPRLSLPYTGRAPAATALEAPDAPFSEAELTDFVDRVRGRDDDRAAEQVAALIARGVAVETIYLDLLAPAARRLGEMWTDDRCDFVDVTVALGRLQRILRDASHLFVGRDTQPGSGRVLLSCIPGEQHSLGLFMVSEFFVRDGWEVSVGAPVIECDLATLLAAEWFDVLGFSVACNSRLSWLSREIPRLRKRSRNRRITVLVGGRVFSDQPEMVDRVHADATASDARAAAALARRLVADRRPDSASFALARGRRP